MNQIETMNRAEQLAFELGGIQRKQGKPRLPNPFAGIDEDLALMWDAGWHDESPIEDQGPPFAEKLAELYGAVLTEAGAPMDGDDPMDLMEWAAPLRKMECNMRDALQKVRDRAAEHTEPEYSDYVAGLNDALRMVESALANAMMSHARTEPHTLPE